MMSRTLRSTTTLLSVLTLAACGGGGGGGVAVDPDFQAALDGYSAATAAIGFGPSSAVPSTPTATVTLAGGVVYTGQMGLIVRDSGSSDDITLTETALTDEGMIGDITITVGVPSGGGQELSGTASNFVAADGTVAGGSLTMAPAAVGVAGGGITYAATAFTGSLTNTPVDDVVLDGLVVGGFADPDAVLFGEAKSASTTPAGTNPFLGRFVADD